MTVLFINPVGTLGGAERSLLDLLWSLRRHDPRLALSLLTFSSGPLLGKAEELGVTVDVLDLPSSLSGLGEDRSMATGAIRAGLVALPTLRFVRKLTALLKERKPEIIHTNGFKSHILAALANAERLPLLWHIRDFLSHRPIMRRVMPALRSRATAAVAISATVADDVRPFFQRFPVHVLLNGVRTSTFSRERVRPLDLDRLANLPPQRQDAVRVGFVSTYANWKGHSLFLDAIGPLLQPQIRAYIVGGPLYMTRASQVTADRLHSEVANRGLANHCGLIPFQEDVAPIYAALDIVVHASTRPEPFGRTVAEGMASGCAVVASGEGGPTEQIADGLDGLLFSPREPEHLRAQIRLLLERPELRTALASRAVQSARERLDADRLGPECAKLYMSLQGRHARTGNTQRATSG